MQPHDHESCPPIRVHRHTNTHARVQIIISCHLSTSRILAWHEGHEFAPKEYPSHARTSTGRSNKCATTALFQHELLSTIFNHTHAHTHTCTLARNHERQLTLLHIILQVTSKLQSNIDNQALKALGGKVDESHALQYGWLVH